MHFSKKTDYALIFLTALRDCYGGDNSIMGVREVAEKYGIPYSFMEKVVLDLKKAGIVGARKGRGGGYALAKNPKQITILDIIKIFERPKIMKCFDEGGAPCLLLATCPTKKRWQALDKKILKVFEGTLLSEL